MKKMLCSVMICVMVVCAASCGTNEGEKAQQVTLKIALPGGELLTPTEIVDSFRAKYPNITLSIDEAAWSDLKTKLKMQVAAGNAPSTFVMDSGYVASLGAMGALEDLSGNVERHIDSAQYSASLYSGRDSDGRLWGIPHGINSIAVYYNKKIFDAAGIPYPGKDWTFDEMLAIAERLTKDLDGDGNTDQYGFSMGNNITEGWLPFVVAMGGAPLDESRTRSMFKDEKTISGMEKYAYPVTSGIAPDSDWITANGNNIAAFYSGKIAMLLTQSANAGTINRNMQEGFEYDVQAVPVGWDGGRDIVYVPNQWVIYSRATEAEKEASWKWIEHYIGEESQKIVAETRLGGFPIKNSALEHIGGLETIPANIEAFYNEIDECGVTIFENATFEEWNSLILPLTRKIRDGKSTVADTIDEIDGMVTDVLSE